MVEVFLDFSQKKGGKHKIYTKIYNLLATGQKASGQCLFQGCMALGPVTPVLGSPDGGDGDTPWGTNLVRAMCR